MAGTFTFEGLAGAKRDSGDRNLLDIMSRPLSNTRQEGLGETTQMCAATGSTLGFFPTLPLRADVLLSHTIFEDLDGGITEDFLHQHTGEENLENVGVLELQVDTIGGAHQAECIGRLLPNVQQLRLNNSNVGFIRDFGTGLLKLQVLWLCRSSLQDIGGITALPCLQELYISFNDVRELSSLCMHEALQVLDVEGNLIESFDEVESLQSVTTLRELTLSSNAVCKSEACSRDAIFHSLPQLKVLDDVPRDCHVPDAPGLLSREVSSEITGDEDLKIDGAADWQFEGNSQDDAQDGESRALKELRCRSHSACPPSRQGRAEPEVSNTTAASLAAGGKKTSPPCSSAAVAELRARLKTLRCAPQELQFEDLAGDPGEDDLIVEGLKRAQSVPKLKRPSTSFCPQARPAWMSDCARSLCSQRPTTAGSDTGSAWSVPVSSGSSAFDVMACASDLTAGDDGEALVGSGLAAIRRRRKHAAAVEGERGGVQIRDLLRRFEATKEDFSQQRLPSQADPEARQRRAALERLNQTSFQIRPVTSSSASRPSSSSAAIRRKSASSHGKRKTSETSLDLPAWFPAPTFSTKTQEVLLLE